MKKIFVLIGIVFLYIPAHFLISHNVAWYRSDVPDLLTNQIADACVQASSSGRGRRQINVINFACTCIATEVKKRYYLEEYLLMAGKIAVDKVAGGNESQARIGGRKLADIQSFCIDEAAYQFQ